MLLIQITVPVGNHTSTAKCLCSTQSRNLRGSGMSCLKLDFLKWAQIPELPKSPAHFHNCTAFKVGMLLIVEIWQYSNHSAIHAATAAVIWRRENTELLFLGNFGGALEFCWREEVKNRQHMDQIAQVFTSVLQLLLFHNTDWYIRSVNWALFMQTFEFTSQFNLFLHQYRYHSYSCIAT